jgi:peroxiredoxin
MNTRKSLLINIAIGFLLVINGVFFILVLSKSERKDISSNNIPKTPSVLQDDLFIDQTCPDFSMNTINGNNINLRELAGKIILIKFSKFYRTDISDLSYLEHITSRFSDKGVELILVDSLGSSNFKAIKNVYDFSSPIVADQTGALSAVLSASQDEFIMIDRHLKIKMKINYLRLRDKTTIYKKLLSLLFSGNEIYSPPGDTEIITAFNKAMSSDVIRGDISLLSNHFDEYSIIALFTSTCTGCKESARITLLRSLADDLHNIKANIIILFGMNNIAAEIKRFALINNWNRQPISIYKLIIGQDFDSNNYQCLFNYDTDPRILIIKDKTKLIFKEDMLNTNRINKEYLLDMMK